MTTKLWISDYGPGKTPVAFDASLRRLGLDYVDLYLLHQPAPADFDDTIAAYQAAEKLLADGKALGILTEAWLPIGSIHRYRTHPVITEIATRHGKTPAQVILRWHLDEGRSALPKPAAPSRIAENFGVFDFTLLPDELAAIDALDTGVRGGSDPELINTRTYTRSIDNS